MLTLLYLTCHVLLTVVTMLIVGKHIGLVGKIYPYTPPQETGLGTPLAVPYTMKPPQSQQTQNVFKTFHIGSSLVSFL